MIAAGLRGWIGSLSRVWEEGVLTLIAIEATAQVDALTHFFWRPNVEISLDCFICCRVGRTMLVEHGHEAGRCMSARERPEQIPLEVHSLSETMFVHAAPLRIARFDHTSDRAGSSTLRCTLSYWYAPFTDLKRQRPSSRLGASPWTRLPYGLGCRACDNAGVDGALSPARPLDTVQPGMASDRVVPHVPANPGHLHHRTEHHRRGSRDAPCLTGPAAATRSAATCARR